MSSISGSAKSKATSASNTPNNVSNVADLDSNVQKSSLITGIISEVRPGGDIILETKKGRIRANCKFQVEEGDRAQVRITAGKNSEVKSEVFVVFKDGSNQASEINKPSFMNFLKNIISGEARHEFNNALTASFSYISPNLKVLEFGHIRPGDRLKIQILDAEEAEGKSHIITGSVISNEGRSIMANTEIGIINIDAKSNLEAGQKIIIHLIQAPGSEKTEDIKKLIASLMSNVTQNMDLLKKILIARNSITSRSGYKNLLKLYLSPHDGAILAKIFHQSGEIPASEVAKWIEREIVKPFEDAAQNYRLGFLGSQMTEVRNLLEAAYILPQNEWKEVNIPIPDTTHKAILKVKKSDKLVNFTLNITHPIFGDITLDGILELNLTNNSIANFRMNIIHSKELPEMLISNLKSIFTDHIATSNISGNIEFKNLPSI